MFNILPEKKIMDQGPTPFGGPRKKPGVEI